MFKCLGPAHISLRIPPEAAHELAARHGFEGVGLSTQILDLPATDRRRVADDLGRRGLRAGGFNLLVRFDADEETYRAGLADLSRRAAVAAELGFRWCSARTSGRAPTSARWSPTWSSTPSASGPS